jgi:hypothetical protein
LSISKKMNKPTQVISFRLGDEELKALQSHQQPKESLNQAAQRLLKAALGFDAPNTSVDAMSTNVDGLKTEMSAYLESLVKKRFAQIQDSYPQPDNSALADLESKIEYLSKTLVMNIPTTGELDGLRERIDHALLRISDYNDRLATLEAKQNVPERKVKAVLQSSPEPIKEPIIAEDISPQLLELPIPAPDKLDKTEITEAAPAKPRRTYSRKRSTVNDSSASVEGTLTQQAESPTIPAADSLEQAEITEAAPAKSRRTSTSKRNAAKTEKKQELESPTISAPNNFDQEEIAIARGRIMEELKVGTQSPKYKAVAKALDIFTKQLCEQDRRSDSDLEGIRSTVLKSLTTGRKSGKLAPNSPEYKAVTKAIDDFISIARSS